MRNGAYGCPSCNLTFNSIAEAYAINNKHHHGVTIWLQMIFRSWFSREQPSPGRDESHPNTNYSSLYKQPIPPASIYNFSKRSHKVWLSYGINAVQDGNKLPILPWRSYPAINIHYLDEAILLSPVIGEASDLRPRLLALADEFYSHPASCTACQKGNCEELFHFFHVVFQGMVSSSFNVLLNDNTEIARDGSHRLRARLREVEPKEQTMLLKFDVGSRVRHVEKTWAEFKHINTLGISPGELPRGSPFLEFYLSGGACEAFGKPTERK